MGGSAKKVTVGYKYYVGQHLVLCYGPIDAITAIDVAERQAWIGYNTGGTLTIDSDEMFGGKEREGGIAGDVDICMGEPTQEPNDYLLAKVNSTMSAFRGVVSAVLRQLYMGTNPYLKPFRFRAQRIFVRQTEGIDQWYIDRAPIACNNADGTIAPEGSLIPGGILLSFTSFDILHTPNMAGASNGAKGAMSIGYKYTGPAGNGEPAGPVETRYIVLGGANGASIVFNISVWANRADKPGGFDFVLVLQARVRQPSPLVQQTQQILFGIPNSINCFDGECHHVQFSWDFGHSAGNKIFSAAFDGSSLTRVNIDGESFDLKLVQDTLDATTVVPYAVWDNYDPIAAWYTPGNQAFSFSEPYLNITEYIDLTNQDNINKFWNSVTGFQDLGSDGSTPTGTQPYLYCHVPAGGPKTSILTNLGTGPDLEVLDGVGTGDYELDAVFCPRGLYLDINPIHAIRELITDPDWGMGYTEADPDETSFRAAADTIYNEGLGVSFKWDKETPHEDVVNELIRHIDAALYVSRRTGKYMIKLIRNDYDVDSLISLDESNIVKVTNPSEPRFGELVNSVIATYDDHETKKEASFTISDTAMVQAMGGKVVAASINYPMFRCSVNAHKAAQRDLRTLSRQPFSCTIYTTQVAKDLNVGDPFKFSWAKWQKSNLVMRVTGIAFGDGKSNQIQITCSQDIYDMPANAVIENTDSGWVDPNDVEPSAAESIAFEAPYYELTLAFGQTTVDDTIAANTDVGYVAVAAARPTAAINAELWTDAGSGYEEQGTFDFCGTATLSATLAKIATTATLTGMSDLDEIRIGSHVQIDDEICRVDALDTTTGDITLGRGCLDTVPEEHLSGAHLYFWSDSNYGTDTTEYNAPESVATKVTPNVSTGQLALASAPEDIVTLDQRAYRPYPPGDLRINGDSYIDQLYLGVLTITWTDRDRLQQTSGTIYDHTYGDIGPEAGTTYRLQGYIDAVLVHTDEPVTSGVTWTPVGNGRVTVEVHSKRDGVYSMQAPNHTFDYGIFTQPVGQADEADTALALNVGYAFAVGRADETDTAFAFTPYILDVEPVGRSDETDTALALAPVVIRATGMATETDTAFTLADTNWSSVKLLTNFKGADGATTAADNSNSAHTLTFVGNAQLDTGILTPWGDASLLLDGTGDWVSAGDSSDWIFSGEFTIEGFMRLNTTGVRLLFGQSKESSQRSIRVYFEDTGATERFVANFWVTDVTASTHALITGDLNTATGAWVHWAFSRDSSNKMRLHIDGVMQASKTSASGTNFDSNSDFRIGGQENNSSLMNGSMAEVRVSTVCRYPSDSSFTPPTAPFPRHQG